eukprot:g17176.t1
MLGSIASVALDLSLVEGTDGRVFDDDGRRDRYSHEYWFLADFDGGAVRLWQEPPGLHQRQPLVPLGVCPGEHAVSGWGVVVPSPGDSRAGAGEDVGGHPFVISAAPTTFVTHSSRMVIGSANRRVLPITAGVEGSSNAGGGFWGRGDGTASGDKEKCDGSERQPALPGREDQLQSRNGGGGGGGGLCRVCAHTLEEEEGRYDGEGFQFSLTSSVFPRRRRRLMLRTSLIASFAGSGNGTGHAAADGGGQDEHGQESAQEEREIEWAIELREGDSPAAAAREFVSERLGLAVRPKGTAPEVVRGPGAASSADAGGAGEGTAHVGQQAFGGEVAATGERMVRWVTKQLETELAERQVRRSLKRTEAAETASRTSQLRVVLGATVGAATDSGIDLYHPPQVGWLETDVNTLDVTDPSDFTFMLGAEGLVDAFVAEHVWEHLSLPDAHSATRNCERHLRPGGRLRIAVPNPAWYSASASEEGKSRRDVTPGPNKVEMASRTAIPTGLGLPDWLSQEMLMADARDRHLVQFTPELLANVCWSAGLTPFLLEGGGGAAEKVAATGEKGAVGPAAKAARKGGGKDAEVNCTAGNDNEREERSGPRRPKGSASLARFPAAGEDDVKERQRDHLWGHIRRSAAGGDPRGAVSIVMDCVKPTAENINAKHPESLKAGHGVADEQPTRHDAASQQSNFNMSEGLTPPESEPSSPSLYAVPSQRPSSVFDHSLVHPDTSQTVVEANRGFFTGMVAGITSGISHGRGGNDSASRGVVALGKASEAEGPTGEDTDVCSNDRSTGIVVRPVAKATKLHISDEKTESSGVVRTSVCDGQLSAPARWGRGFSLEAGLSVDDTTRKTNVSRGSRLSVLRHGGQDASSNRSPSGLYDDAGGDSPSQAGSIDPGGEVSTAEAHRVGEVHVAAALVRAGDEQQTTGGRGSREATVSRSVPVPLRVDNGTFVPGERPGLRSSPADPEPYEELDENGDDEVHASGVGNKSAQSHYNGESLEEWANAARKTGRVDLPVPKPAEPSSREQQMPSHNNSSSSIDDSEKDGLVFLTLQDLKSARSRAKKALLASNVTGTLEMCQTILRKWPSDGATLLYQGAAMAQGGEWDNAWDRMERVLALSSGVEKINLGPASAAAGYSTTHAGDGQGNTHSSAQQVDADGQSRAAAAAAEVPLDIALAAAANLASFARARAPKTLDQNAETFFLVEGLRGPADQDHRVGQERGKARAKSALPRSSRTSSPAERSKDENGSGNPEEPYKAGRIDGYTDLLIMMAQAFEGKGQLTSALRIYQRAILLGGHRDPRALHGIGGLSRRLLEVEFDLTLLDPGLPSAGSLFETIKVGNSAVESGGFSSEDSAQESKGAGIAVAEDGLGFIVCSYLEAGGGGGEYNNRSGDLTDAEEPGRISKHEDRETMSSSCEGVDLAGGPETPEKDSAKERLFQGGKVKNARTEAPSAEAGDELQAEVALPFCFMTLALNAMPFITHHAPVFDEVGQILSKRAAATAGPSGSSGPSKTAENARGSSNSSFYPEKPPAPPPPEPVSFWEWHVVEGVAAGRANHGNPYSRRRIPDRYFDAGTGLSVDGTTQYLDGLVESGAGANALSSPRPRKVYVHRRCGEPPRSSGPYAEAHKPRVDGVGDDHKWFGGGDSSSDKTRARSTSCLWRDKIQMVNSVAFSLEHECLLVQIDADELWTAEQLVRLRDMFLLERNGHRADDGSTTGAAGGREEQRPAPGHLTEATGSIADREDRQQQHSHNRTSRECAYFDCHFFVGPDLVTVTEDGWGHSAGNEWLRAWVFRPRQSLWLQHAPPQLARHDEAAGWKMLAGDQCISRAETRERGLGFTHYAYVFEEQVRFKDEFYGHSEMVKTADAVAEWVALQEATPPVPLADHLTWLRIQGEAQDPRLLATVADRAPTSNSCRTRLPPISATGTGYPGGGGVGEGNQRGGDAPGTTGTGISLAERDVTAPGQGGCESFPLVPLEPFLQLAKRGSSDNTAAGLWRRAGRYTQAAENKREGLRLTHNANTHLKEHRSRDHRLPRSRSGSRDQQARTGRTASMEQVSAAPDGCGLLHLVVDGAVFQVEAVRPSGITRVWENALPAMLGRLSGFEGTCLTLLVRGQAPPPVAIEAAFSRLPSERFAVAHVPPYNPSFGFVADRIMLSWVVRSAGATAFVSTLHTHPYWATTPNVVRLLLVHDLLPELFGWDMTSGEWLEKLNAVAVASSVVAVSQHTAKDFLRVYPSPHAGNGADTATGRDRPPAAAATTARPVWAAHNGVDTTVFHPRAPSDEKLGRYDGGNSNSNGGQHDSNRANVDSEAFRRAAGLEPGTQYVLIVGSRHGYKNARTVYHAFGRAATSTVAADRLAASVAPALVLVGGGPVTPEELEVLSEVGVWSHIGAGSGIPTGAAPSKPPAGPGTAVVDDRLLAAGYAGAVALLHLSLAEGFGLTVLEAFACGCPVIATDIPPVREIAGLPDLENARAAVAEEDRGSAAAASNGNTIARNSRPPRDGDGSFGVAPTRGKRADRYQGASASLEGGLVLVENPASATQVWRAVRAVVAMGPERRAAVSEALVRRAKVFDSWQPLADTLIKAAVE